MGEVAQCLDEFRVATKASRPFDFDASSGISDADYLTIIGPRVNKTEKADDNNAAIMYI